MSNPVKKALVITSDAAQAADSGLPAVEELLEKAGTEYTVCPVRRAPEEYVEGSDMVIALGGDGTIMHAARAAAPFSVPVLGINYGHKGFNADLERDELWLLERALEGRFRTEQAMMLDCTVNRGGVTVYTGFALNEVVVAGIARAVNICAFSDDELVMQFSGDGIAVATPTGSTAYSLSAGGPIAEPEAECLLVTPICAHLLTAKAFVLSSRRTVKIIPGDLEGKKAYLSPDGGEPFPVAAGDEIIIRKSRLTACFARINDESFYSKISRKLGEIR